MNALKCACWGFVATFATFPLVSADVDVCVNEVLYAPPQGLADAEFIELHNHGAAAVSLSGWKLEGSISFTVPSGVAIPAGGYVLIVKRLNLCASLYPGVTLVGNYSGDLPDDGGRIRLLNRDGVLVDEVEFSSRRAWASEAAGRGASLEKKSPQLDPWFPDSWGASLTVLGTPGRPNTQLREIRELDWIVVGEDWRYFKGTEEPPAEWVNVAFDDSGWLVGPTGIGYGDNDDATVLEDMQGSYTSVYLRKAFTVADPARVVSLLFSVDYDDGFILYLNGAEVARRGAGGSPGVPLPHNATAALAREAGVPETIDLSPEISRLRAGSNVLAIHVLNYTLDSSDLSMIPSLRAEVEVLGSDLGLKRVVSASAIPRSSVWSYFKGREEPSAVLGEWTGLAFDDSSWPSGPAGFGFADNDDATVLTDMQFQYSTVYIRKRFAVSDPSRVLGMTLGVDFDDGFIAYLNGVEVARAYAPGSPGTFQPHTALATGSHEAGTELTYDLSGRLGLLVEGENVLAVQGFNITLSNADFSLHPRLTLTRAVEGDPSAVRSSLQINEVFAAAGSEGWVEILNAGTDAADLGGYGLTDDASSPLKYAFPSGTTLEPGGYLVVSEGVLGFPLGAAGTLVLTDPAGVVLVDGRSYAIPAPGYSAGAYPERGEFQILETPTPGASNAPPPDRGVVINEILYHPLPRPGEAELEWIELYNRSAEAVALAGWKLAGDISYQFSAATIPPGGYAVVANDPARMESRYGISGALGAFFGTLRNDAGEILLIDDLGNVADRVRYAHDGSWPSEADGFGPSLELIHPDLDNANGQAWAASAGEGTPGAPNSAYSTAVAPLVSGLRHSPLVPRPGQPVTVSARVTAMDGVSAVRLFYRVAGAPSFATALMLDEGASGDGEAGDSVYAAQVPGQPAGTVVEFFVEAEGISGLARVVPEDAPDRCALYVADDPEPSLGAPKYRIVMTPSDREELESRDLYSDVLLNATFIAPERAYYAVGVRYRGEASRLLTPKSYRVQFTDDDDFCGATALNLNANGPEKQHLGMQLFRGADVPASLTRMVRLAFVADPERTYVQVEEVDEDFLRRYYPRPEGEDLGNLYEGIGTGNFDYRGPDEDAYRGSYRKVTNEEQDDWSDLIELCRTLEETPDAELPARLSNAIDAGEWIRFFAAHTLLSTQEEGIYRDAGDDYFAYRRPSDGRFVLIPGDLDDSFRQPTERLFRPSLIAIRRILEHPEFTAQYYAALSNLAATHFSSENVAAKLSALAELLPQPTLDSDLSFVGNRLSFVDSKINRNFSVEIRAESVVPVGAAWKFFRGLEEPSDGTLAWTELDFDDSSWESGPSGIGYGDGDDATVLPDMLGSYTTVYARCAFEVPDPGRYPTIELAIDYDDGFVAFLNGTEIARANAGPAGSYPSYNSVATGSREAGIPQVFTVYNASSLLRPGRNVLAVVGLNAAVDSTDFSLAPELRSGGPVGEGCAGEKYVTGSTLYLAGSAPVTSTRWVRVNGEEVPYDRFSGLWTYSLPIPEGFLAVTVQALDRGLAVVATEAFTATRVHTLGGTVSEDSIWTKARSPYLVLSSINVPAGVRLTIEPGCVFWISEGAGFDIAGEIQALGTQEAPILFTRVPCRGNWGFLNLRSRGANRLDHCEFSRATGSPGCITVSGADLEIEGCHIHDIDGEGVSASGSTINIRNTVVEKTNEALSLDYCRTVVEFNTLRNAVGKSDLCDANGSNNPPARLAFNAIYGTSDDGIDADKGSVYAEGNIIHDCGDQGISLVGTPGNSTIYRNVIYRNGVGIAVKDSHVALVDFNTVAYNRNIGVRAIEKNAGLGGGKITLKNSIVWGSPVSLYVDSTGTIVTSYCDIQNSTFPPGPGDINLDPQFVNAAANDYRLQSTSPCIGAAEGGEDMGAIPYELAPRAPADLVVTGTQPGGISLAWKDRSLVEEGFYLERRVVPRSAATYLVKQGDVWKFFRGRSEPSGGTLAWTEIDFDDSSWESGPSGIGYGDGDDATILPDMQNRYSTVYLRRAFEVGDPSAVTSLEFRIDIDDGFVAYLNGREIARFAAGSPGTILAYNALASADHEAGTPLEFEVPLDGLLLPGKNVLAIQALNASLGSSDLTVIPELRDLSATPFELLATLPPNSASYVDRDIGPTARYSYRVRAFNSYGVSAPSNIVSVEAGTIPDAPTNLTVIDFGLGWVALAWTDNATNEDRYEVERSPEGGEFELLATLGADSFSYLDAAALPGATYSYRVRAVNSYGPSAYSNVVTQVAGSPPSAPSDLAAGEVSLDSIELTWRDNSDDETAFELEVRVEGGEFHLREILLADATRYVDQGLESGRTYWYRIRAVNPAGASEYSNTVEATTGRLPNAPMDLTVVGVGLGWVALAWEDASDDETGFELERRGPGEEDFSLVALLPAGSTLYTDSGLSSDSVYEYRVRAVNVWGPSGYSNVVSAKTGRLPVTPSGLTVDWVGLSEVHLSWIDNSDDEIGFELERSEAGSPFVKIADLPSNAIAYTDSGLLPGTEYAYRIRAVNAFGPSAYSAPVSCVTGRLPAAPSGLALTARGHDSIAFSWSDNSDNESGFAIERSDAGGDFLVVAQLSENSTSFRDTGLLPGTAYAYRVFAFNAFGRSEPSETLEATTGRFPEAPSDLVAAAESPYEVGLSWRDNSDNETGFEIERSSGEGGAFLKIADVPAEQTSYLDTGLLPGRTYSYRVRAVNEFGASGYSEAATVRTRVPVPRVQSVEPSEGPSGGGTEVVIAGSDFLEVLAVLFGETEVSGFEVETATKIRCVAPGGARGKTSVTVRTTGGEDTLGDAFHYYDVYARGDTNADSALNISDPIALLSFLFLGGEPAPCVAVGDANNDEVVDLSDAVYVLRYLFMGGDPIVPEEARCY